MLCLVARYQLHMERPAYLAGAWYPASDGDCRNAIEAHAADVRPKQGHHYGLIGPHAGFPYSGTAAGRTYRCLAESLAPDIGGPDDVDLVVIFGGHLGVRSPHTLFRGTCWQTPLGAIQNASTLVEALSVDIKQNPLITLAMVEEPTQPQQPDNAVELHLPFVRYFFPRAEILVLGVAAASEAVAFGDQVAQTVMRSNRRALYIGSTDLTHYGVMYDFSKPEYQTNAEAAAWVRAHNDAGLIDRIMRSDPHGVVAHASAHSSACCPGAVAAAMAAVTLTETTNRKQVMQAQLRNARDKSRVDNLSCLDTHATSEPNSSITHSAVLVDHYLSYDVRPAESFVGYAGVLL